MRGKIADCVALAHAANSREDFHARTRKPLLTHPKLFLAQVNDMSLEDYVAVKPKYAVVVPHTAGRYQTKRFRKAQCPIVER